jgi:deoxyribonuclease V
MTEQLLHLRTPDLETELARLVSQIPSGRVTTYGTLATTLGNVVASRWTGEFLRRHTHNDACPCHRVVRVDGSLGLYVSGDTDDKERLLVAEGVIVADQRLNLQEYLFDRFVSSRPLKQLTDLQTSIQQRVLVQDNGKTPRFVGGIDVSYSKERKAIAGYALVDITRNELVWQTTLCAPVRFPYIPTYLAFRELPIMAGLLRKVENLGRVPDVLLVDGSGILHPRRSGIASMLGVVAGLPTVGVTKKLLCGNVDREQLLRKSWTTVRDDGLALGTAILPSTSTRRPIYVSPGHRIDVRHAAAIVKKSLGNRRLPEPIYWADRISREAARAADSRHD